MAKSALAVAVALVGVCLGCDDKKHEPGTIRPPAAAEWVVQYTVVAQVQSIQPIGSFKGQTVRTSVRPEYALTIHNLRPVLGEPPAGPITYAVANVERLVGTTQPASGKWYRFTLSRSKITNNQFLAVEPFGDSPPPVRVDPGREPAKTPPRQGT
jgi:hypothetical protein